MCIFTHITEVLGDLKYNMAPQSILNKMISVLLTTKGLDTTYTRHYNGAMSACQMSQYAEVSTNE